MANAQNMKLLGIVLIVVGVGLIGWGLQMSDSFGNEMSEALTGASTDGVMTRYIAGAASLAVGLALYFKRG